MNLFSDEKNQGVMSDIFKLPKRPVYLSNFQHGIDFESFVT